MDTYIDHYAVLGLPSGEEGTKLTKDEISKAFRSKSLELHPDKRPDDPDANINFHKPKTSYDILKDEKQRKLFDDMLLRQKHKDKFGRQTQEHPKRRKIKTSYVILKDEKASKRFDNLVGQKYKDKFEPQTQDHSKRRKMMADLEERERAAFDTGLARAEEERTFRKLQEEISRIRAEEERKLRNLFG